MIRTGLLIEINGPVLQLFHTNACKAKICRKSFLKLKRSSFKVTVSSKKLQLNLNGRWLPVARLLFKRSHETLKFKGPNFTLRPFYLCQPYLIIQSNSLCPVPVTQALAYYSLRHFITTFVGTNLVVP